MLLKTPHVVALMLVLMLATTAACGRKPTTLDAPESTAKRIYPPLESSVAP